MRLPRGSALALAVLALALADGWVAVRGNPVPIGPEVLRAAAAALAEVEKPGDLLVSSPLFTVRELQALGAHAGSPHVPPPAVRRARRVVVLDRRDHPIYGLSGGTVRPVPESRGLLEVRVLEPEGSGEAVLFELHSGLSATTLHVERGGKVTSSCTQVRPEGGFMCPGEPEWLYAAERVLRIDGQDSTCVWAHPTTDGVMVYQIPAQPPPGPGRRLLLKVEAGMTDDAVRQTADGAPVRTEVQQGGESRGTLTAPNRIGWARTTVYIAPGKPVELRVTTPKDGRRHHCLNATVIDAEEERR